MVILTRVPEKMGYSLQRQFKFLGLPREEISENRPYDNDCTKKEDLLFSGGNKSFQYISGNKKFQSENKVAGKCPSDLGIGNLCFSDFPQDYIYDCPDPAIYDQDCTDDSKQEGKESDEVGQCQSVHER